MRCPDLVADDLSGFWRCSKPGDRDATRGTDGAVYRGAGALSGWAVELRRGSGVTGDQRAAFPAASRPLRGGWGRRSDRPAPGPGIGAAGGGGPDRVCGRAIPDAVLGFHGEAFPRSAADGAPVCSELQLDQSGAAEPRPGGHRAEALGAPQEAPAPTVAGDDAVSRRLDPRLAGGS